MKMFHHIILSFSSLCVLSTVFSNDICRPPGYVRSCYYEDWSAGWEQPYRFTPSDLIPGLCTHVIYAFAVLDRSSYENIVPHDPDLTYDAGFYKKITDMPDTCATLGIGGWNDSDQDWHLMLKDENKRNTFSKRVTEFIITNGFRGADVALNYPAAWQGDIENSDPMDKQYYAQLLVALRTEFNIVKANLNIDLLLTASVSAGRRIIEVGYDFEIMKENLDWITVMTYDFHGPWDSKIGLVAPFTAQPTDTASEKELNVVSAMNMWLANGIPSQQLVLSVPFYGQMFTTTGTKIGDPSNGRGQIETPSFHQLVDFIRNENGWIVTHLEIGTYASNSLNQQWVSYDDKNNIARKAFYIIESGFRGMMTWAVNKDYFKDSPCGDYPLITTVKDVLTGKITDLSQVGNCT